MAKKYLLYIHHPAFEVEKEKSGLVNKLLIEHYDNKTVGDVRYVEEKKPKDFIRPIIYKKTNNWGA